MNSRLTAAVAVCALVLALCCLSPSAPAQGTSSSKGIFSSLKLGQMVELSSDPGIGAVIRTYDDPAKKALMTGKVLEIGEDHVVIQVAGSAVDETWEFRIPVQTLASILHVKTKKSSK